MRGPASQYTIVENNEQFNFNNLIMPILVKLRDVNILAFLLKVNGFVFSSQDFLEFVKFAKATDWIEGINTIMWSNNA